MSAEETIRRIQAEARRIVAESKRGPLPIAKPKKKKEKPVEVPKPVEQKPKVNFDALVTEGSNKLRMSLGEILSTIDDSVRNTVLELRDIRKNLFLIPRNCVLSIEGKNPDGNSLCGTIVLEDSPQVRTIFYKNTTYRIPLPYVTYIVSWVESKADKPLRPAGFSVSQMGMGFRKAPLQTVDDLLLKPSLPHTYSNTHLCQPVDAVYPTIKALAEGVISTFWQSKFHYEFDEDNKFIHS